MSSKKKSRKSTKKSSKLKIYEDKDYKFKYKEIEYKNKTNPYLEILRYHKWNKVIDESVDILKENKITLKSSKKSLRQIVSDNLSMWISINIMKKNKLDDPIIPYNAKSNDVFIKTLVYLGKIDIKKSKDIFKQMDIVKKCNKIVKEIGKENNKKYKNVFFSKNKLIYKSDDVTKKIPCAHKLYHHLKKRYTLVLVGPQQRITPFQLLLVHGPRFVVDLSCPPLPTSVAESLTTVSFLFFAVLCVVCVSASKKGKASVWAATPN